MPFMKVFIPVFMLFAIASHLTSSTKPLIARLRSCKPKRKLYARDCKSISANIALNILPSPAPKVPQDFSIVSKKFARAVIRPLPALDMTSATSSKSNASTKAFHKVPAHTPNCAKLNSRKNARAKSNAVLNACAIVVPRLFAR